MSIIVYRRGVLAADTLITAGDLRAGYSTKIARSPQGHMGGGAGSLEGCAAFLAWIRDGCKGSPPDVGGEQDWLLVGPPKRGAREISYGTGKGLLAPMHPNGPKGSTWAASGSGERIAAGALWMGATAVEAVEAAIALSSTCGGRVETLTT